MGKKIIKGYVTFYSEWDKEDMGLFKEKMPNDLYTYKDEENDSFNSIMDTLDPLRGKKVKITIEVIGD